MIRLLVTRSVVVAKGLFIGVDGLLEIDVVHDKDDGRDDDRADDGRAPLPGAAGGPPVGCCRAQGKQ